MCRLTVEHAVSSGSTSSSAPDRVQLPREVIPSHYCITIAPHFPNWTFDAKVAINCTAQFDSNVVTLNAIDLDVRSAAYCLNSAPTNFIFAEPPVYNRDEQTVTLRFPGPGFTKGQALQIVIEYSGLIGDNMVGFYRSTYQHNGAQKHMAVTQFEAVDCRRAIPSFDEPELKAVFTISLVVEKHLTALSNTEVVSDIPSTSTPSKRIVTFAPTPKMSTYLLAFAVGEFDYVETFTRPTAFLEKPVRCRVYTPPGQADLGKFALEVGARTLEYFSEIFGIPYPLSKCDQVAIPDFSAGAMENWGLITYRTVSLLVDNETGSVDSKKWVATTVTHELAHQWFGNLVTFSFWDELWLNEGFATWVGTLGAAHLFPAWDMWSIFIAEDQNSAFSADGVRTSHPIQVPVRDAKEIAQIFDNISYSKGASVIHMLTNWLGLEPFLAGIRIYLAKHAYANATTVDLWAALSEASGCDVAAFMSNWTGEVGYPVVSVTQRRDEKSGTLRLELSQHRFLQTADVSDDDDKTIWHVPLDLAPVESSATLNLVPTSGSTSTLNGDSFSGSNSTLTERSIDLDLRIESECCLVNSRRGGFYRVAYDDKSLAIIGDAISAGKIPSTTRMGIYDDAFALARGGVKSLTGFLGLVRKALPTESQYSVFLDVSASLSTVRNVWSGQSEKDRQRLNAMRLELFTPLATKAGFDHKKNESALDKMLRPVLISNAGMAGNVAIVDEARKRFKALVAGTANAVPSDMYRSVISVSVAHGAEQELEDAMKVFESTKDLELRYAALSSLGHTRMPNLIPRVLKYCMSAKVRPQDIHYILGSLSVNALARMPLFEFLMQNWDLLLKRYESNFDVIGSCVSYATFSFTTREELKMVKEAFSTKDTSMCNRKLNQSYSQITANIAWLERDTEKVSTWLSRNYGDSSAGFGFSSAKKQEL